MALVMLLPCRSLTRQLYLIHIGPTHLSLGSYPSFLALRTFAVFWLWFRWFWYHLNLRLPPWLGISADWHLKQGLWQHSRASIRCSLAVATPWSDCNISPQIRSHRLVFDSCLVLLKLCAWERLPNTFSKLY